MLASLHLIQRSQILFPFSFAWLPDRSPSLPLEGRTQVQVRKLPQTSPFLHGKPCFEQCAGPYLTAGVDRKKRQGT